MKVLIIKHWTFCNEAYIYYWYWMLHMIFKGDLNEHNNSKNYTKEHDTGQMSGASLNNNTTQFHETEKE